MKDRKRVYILRSDDLDTSSDMMKQANQTKIHSTQICVGTLSLLYDILRQVIEDTLLKKKSPLPPEASFSVVDMLLVVCSRAPAVSRQSTRNAFELLNSQNMPI